MKPMHYGALLLLGAIWGASFLFIGVAVAEFGPLALILFSTSFAYLLYFYLLQNVGATRTASVTFLVPVFGAIWGILFLQEPFNAGMLLGMTIILASVGLVTGMQISKRNLTQLLKLSRVRES